MTCQWLIIQGRAFGKLLLPSLARKVRPLLAPVQQEQLLPCPFCARRGAWELRSFVEMAVRLAASIVASDGIVRMARSDETPHPGQGCGWSNSDMGRKTVKSPHAVQL